MKPLLTIGSWLLLATGAFFGWRGAADYYESVHSQSEAAASWDAKLPEDLNRARENPLPAHTHTTRANTNPRGYSVARLTIPRLDTTLYILEGTDDQDLKRGPGHLETSVMPGDEGNCVIAGHRDTHFRVLKNIAKGDIVTVQSHTGSFRYRVSGLSIVEPQNTECLKPTTTGVLNLITCFPFDYVGSAPRRFVVHADLIPSRDSKG